MLVSQIASYIVFAVIVQCSTSLYGILHRPCAVEWLYTSQTKYRDNAINDEKQSNYNIVYESSDTCYHKIKQNNAI